ncbi:uncharacterized protein LOC105845692 isoform X1 [Hydra vulgaris]|uniref:uncharacterized protein LOC105845692 isoform X1 n=1 Tax=Hydra vulgaris TaxID=6087 RepID=UPI001F5F1677|nr:uncharacterized protein LOC105845692 [Hydra vulgaris]
MNKYYLQTIVFVAFNEILIHGLFKSVTRQTESDFFVKSSCENNCNPYKSYCFDVENSGVTKSTCCSCKCEWGKTFYGIGKSASCVDDLQASNDCRFQVVKQNEQEKVFSVSISKSYNKGIYESIGSIKLIDKQTLINSLSCSLLLKKTSFWEPFQWTSFVEPQAVFRLNSNTNLLEMKNIELYKGYLFKLFLSCNNVTSCLLLKVVGQTFFQIKPAGSRTTLSPALNVTLIPVKTKPMLTKKQKSTRNMIIIIVAIVIFFIIMLFAGLLVFHKRKLKRKNKPTSDQVHQDDTQVQLINRETLQSSNRYVRTFDDNAYVDPNICRMSKYEGKGLCVEPNGLLNINEKESFRNSDVKNTEKKNYPDNTNSNTNVSLSNGPEKKKDPNYEYPIVAQLTVKEKQKNEYESCGRVQLPTHEYVDITGVNDGKTHYYTDPDKILQSYKKERVSEYVKPNLQDIGSNGKNNSEYTKLLPNIPTSSFEINESTKSKNESNNSHYTFLLPDSHEIPDKNKNHGGSNFNLNPSGYAQLTTINNKITSPPLEDLSPKYYMLEPDDSTAEEIAI